MNPGARAVGKRRRYPKSRSCCMACWNAAKRDFVLLRAHKHADAPHLLRLLRMRRKRPCCAPPSSDKRLTSPHWKSPVPTRRVSAGNELARQELFEWPGATGVGLFLLHAPAAPRHGAQTHTHTTKKRSKRRALGRNSHARFQDLERQWQEGRDRDRR